MFKLLSFLSVMVMMMPLLQYAHAQTAQPSVPLLDQWQQQMIQYGTQHCQTLQSSSVGFDDKLSATYYDAERVYYQIAAYTNDSNWLACAQAAEEVYRESYLFGNGGKLPGFWMFPHGLWKDYKQTQDSRSRDALLLLAENGAYAQDTIPLDWLTGPEMSREVAYNLQNKILARDLGATTDAAIQRFANVAFGHIDAWFISKTAPYIRPFMVALTSEALIVYYNRTGDARVLPTLKMAWDTLSRSTWIPGCMCFMYTDRPSNDGTGGQEPAPDLNLLIAPVFGWLYYQTGDIKYRDLGDQIFQGGVTQASLYLPKQFNQSYRWSFDYIAWRNKTNKVFISFDSTSNGTAPASPQGLRVQ
jgi:hypothetical protein